MMKIDSLELLSCYIMDIVHVIKCSLKMGFFFLVAISTYQNLVTHFPMVGYFKLHFRE